MSTPPPQSDCNLAALLCVLSFTTGLALGARMEHGLRSASIGLQIADRLGLPDSEREAVYYGALLKDVGCSACAAGFAAFFPDDELVPRLDFMLVDPTRLSEMVAWVRRMTPLDAQFPTRLTRLTAFVTQCGTVITEAMRGHCEIAELFARHLGFPEPVQRAVRFQLERWDGRSPAYGLPGKMVPVAARILHLAQVVELANAVGGHTAARTVARERRGNRFDPSVVDAFLAVAERPAFWSLLEREQAQEEILAMRPPSEADRLAIAQPEVLCEAMADFVDAKLRDRWNHSRAVAAVACRVGEQLGLRSAELVRLRHAALVHDLGIVALPYGILHKNEESLSTAEMELYRLHPYYAQRVLDRVEPLQELAEAAASHHERVDGQGYFRRLRGEQISRNGRILALAEGYAELRPRTAADPREIVRQLRASIGTRFAADCLEALAASLADGETVTTPTRPSQPGKLTEREVEVLRLLARGYSNPKIAAALVVSRKTIEHHLEHIFDKLGVTCRTSAVAYAVRYGLAS